MRGKREQWEEGEERDGRTRKSRFDLRDEVCRTIRGRSERCGERKKREGQNGKKLNIINSEGVSANILVQRILVLYAQLYMSLSAILTTRLITY